MKGELAYQGLMFAARAPQTDVALGNEPFSEVQLTERKQNLFDDTFVDQTDLLGIGLLDRCERGEDPDESGHRGSVCLVHLADSELAVIRVQHAISPDLVLTMKGLRLELALL